MNTKAPKTANKNANIIINVNDNDPKNTNAIKIPNCAESVIPTTDGETNLFFEMVCIINPETLIEVAVNMIATVRGNLELKTMNHTF